MKTKEANRPAYVKKIGNVRTVVWANSSGNSDRIFFNVQVSRTYRDGDEFKESPYLNGSGDVACLREALRYVADWLSSQDDGENMEGEQ